MWGVRPSFSGSVMVKVPLNNSFFFAAHWNIYTIKQGKTTDTSHNSDSTNNGITFWTQCKKRKTLLLASFDNTDIKC